MTREESLQIVGMILSHWRGKEWTKDEMDVYARLIQDMDAAITTSAIIRAAKEIQYRPSVAELREYVRAERTRLRATMPKPEEPRGAPYPFWVKRWICARMLYRRFDRDQDMRRFPEQGDWGDLTSEVMPEGEWVDEANRVDDKEFSKAFKQFVRA